MIHGLVKFHSSDFDAHRREIDALLESRAAIQLKLQNAANAEEKQQILILEFRPVQTEIKELASRVCLK